MIYLFAILFFTCFLAFRAMREGQVGLLLTYLFFDLVAGLVGISMGADKQVMIATVIGVIDGMCLLAIFSKE